MRWSDENGGGGAESWCDEGTASGSAAGRLSFSAMVTIQSSVLVVGLVLGYLAGLPAPWDASIESSILRSGLWLGFGWKVSLATGLLTALGLFWLVFGLNRWKLGWLSDVEDSVQRLLVPSLRVLRVWQLGVISLLAGVGEELCFRWAIQGWIERSLQWVVDAGWINGLVSGAAAEWLPFLLAVLIAATLFGLAHAVSVPYVVLASVMGCILGLEAGLGGVLLAAMVTHALYDFLACLWLTGCLPGVLLGPLAENR